MRNRIRRCLLLFALFLTLGGAAAAQVTSPEPSSGCSIPTRLTRERPDPDGEPVAVEVRISLIDLLGVDDAAESFGVDLLLDLRWRDPRLSAAALGGSLEDCSFGLAEVWHPRVGFLNQRRVGLQQMIDVDVDAEGSVRVVERTSADFSSPLELRDFPFDSQELRIQLASYEYGPEDVLFVAEEGGSRPGGVFLAGWTFSGNRNVSGLPPLVSTAGKSTRLDHVITLERRAGYHVWRFVVPLIFIALMAASVFWLDPEGWAPQLGIASASVFTLMAYLIGVREGLPRVAYLTRMDELVLCGTVLVFLALGEVIVTSRLAQRDRVQLARRIDHHARWVYLSLFAIALLGTMVR